MAGERRAVGHVRDARVRRRRHRIGRPGCGRVLRAGRQGQREGKQQRRLVHARDSVRGNVANAQWCRTGRSEEHKSELQSLMRISYAVFCLKKKKKQKNNTNQRHTKINNTTSAQISTIKRKYTKHITHKNRTTTYTLDNTPTKNINSKNLSKQRYRKHSNT